MPIQTILWIPTSHRRYAEMNGAKYDSRQGIWYVNGDIPPALADYVAPTLRRRDIAQECIPRCATCGHAMVWIDAQRPFWGCSSGQKKGCRGIRSDDYSVCASIRTAVSRRRADTSVCSTAFVRGIHLTRILLRLRQCLAHDRILIWLNENRVEFRGKSALELLGTTEGLRHVETFIAQAFQR